MKINVKNVLLTVAGTALFSISGMQLNHINFAPMPIQASTSYHSDAWYIKHAKTAKQKKQLAIYLKDQASDSRGLSKGTIAKATKSKTNQTSGFNFNGYHFGIKNFSGLGEVPATQYVYRWNEIPNWYLIEETSQPGYYAWKLKVGNQVTVNNHAYTIYKKVNIANDNNAYPYVVNTLQANGGIGWQECNPSGTLTLWFAK